MGFFLNLIKSIFLIPSLLGTLKEQRYSPVTTETIVDEYDYIIVGAGSAGSVVASRLSEIPCVRVLLLEAGGEPPLLTEVPALARFFWFSSIDWKYLTTPQKHTGSKLYNRQLIWPSGKGLGGSSILNAMLYVRGNRMNYDGWAADGAEGWSYKDVLPYFIKLEDNKDPEYLANGYHGEGGPITVQKPPYHAEIKDPIFETIDSMGYQVVDPNAYNQTGFYDFQANIRNGQRCSTAKGYLVPAENRTNLDILTGAMVRKVLIENRRAVGVQFDHKGNTWEVRARKEVIMSAGTTNTAQLLMLSGIGPRRELEKHGIPVIADLPVGFNLQDHPGVPVLYALNRKIPSVIKKLVDPDNIEQYIQNRSGMKACKRIGSSPEMQKVVTPFETLLPGCEEYDGDDDAYFTCFVRSVAITFNHQVGTARMGNPQDARTVVDPQLRVLNIEGLRVVDASVMPTTPSGNTNIPTIMVAEKASDIIKSTIACSNSDVNVWSNNYLF